MAPPEDTHGDVNARLRRLPKVDEVLRGDPARRLLSVVPRWAVVAAVRAEIAALRERILGTTGEAHGPDAGDTAALGVAESALEARVAELLRPTLRRVLNATGVVLHTNLGRAPLASAALARIVEVAGGYSNLEYRLTTGERGSRHEHMARLLGELTGAEAALVVNNCAAAVLLALGALAAGREVIVSRGELVEIGGSFRVPDVMRASGARLVEVGTTNRTHLRDYEQAITPETALLLKVHRSNFALVGFTAEVGVADLARLGQARGVPVMVDLGSGCLLAAEELGLGAEPNVQETVEQGADVITFSGDKLLGGPQAGVVLGREALLGRLRQHPLLRALRPDKLCLAALAATLELYRDGRSHEVPALGMLRASPETLRQRAERLHQLLRDRAPALMVSVIELRSAVGGGALPLEEPLSWGVSVRHPRLDAVRLEARLRQAEPPLVARIVDDRVVADVRTLADTEVEAAARALAQTLDREVL